MAKRNVFSDYELLELKVLYNSGFVCGDGSLDAYCLKHNRTKQLVCRKANEIGLTSRQRKFSDVQILRISNNLINRIKENGHPKGFLGGKHTAAAKKIMSEKSSKSWSDPLSTHNTEENKQRRSDKMSYRMTEGDLSGAINSYSRVKSGKIIIAGIEFYVRSSWEANIASYLQFKVENGLILSFKYESKTFWFLNILRGVRSYKPDFEIENLDGTIHYIEVKGWMDDKSKTKLKRMAKYYPEIKIELIDQLVYKSIAKNKKIYKYWGQLDNKGK